MITHDISESQDTLRFCVFITDVFFIGFFELHEIIASSAIKRGMIRWLFVATFFLKEIALLSIL